MSLFTRITVIALEWKLHYNSPRQLKSPPLLKAWKVAPLDLVNIWVSEISRVKWAEINWTVLMEASLGFLSIFFVDGWTTSFHLVRCLFKLLQHTINHSPGNIIDGSPATESRAQHSRGLSRFKFINRRDFEMEEIIAHKHRRETIESYLPWHMDGGKL